MTSFHSAVVRGQVNRKQKWMNLEVSVQYPGVTERAVLVWPWAEGDTKSNPGKLMGLVLPRVLLMPVAKWALAPFERAGWSEAHSGLLLVEKQKLKLCSLNATGFNLFWKPIFPSYLLVGPKVSSVTSKISGSFKIRLHLSREHLHGTHRSKKPLKWEYQFACLNPINALDARIFFFFIWCSSSLDLQYNTMVKVSHCWGWQNCQDYWRCFLV